MRALLTNAYRQLIFFAGHAVEGWYSSPSSLTPAFARATADEMADKCEPSSGAETPHLNPLPYTTTACRRTPLPPRGEEIAGRAKGRGRGRIKHAILRNEPICKRLCKRCKHLCILLMCRKMHNEPNGFVFENEPIFRRLLRVRG